MTIAMRPRTAAGARRVPARALAAFLDARWAIEPTWLDRMRAVLERDEVDLGAIAAELGEPLQETARVTVRDGVATVPIRGPLFRYANLMTEFCGATSYECTAIDFARALADPGVHTVVLDLDSPGGEVAGCANLAALIAGSRGSKPIVAYGSGGCVASAAYWIASACDEVIVAPDAIVGSIGTVLTAIDTSAQDAERGIRRLEVVSSQSPKKRADLATDEGLAEAQRLVDELAEAFIDAVAMYRGVTPDEVLARYGQGAVFVGRHAVEAGLADDVMTHEVLHAALLAAADAVPARTLYAQQQHQQHQSTTTRR